MVYALKKICNIEMGDFPDCSNSMQCTLKPLLLLAISITCIVSVKLHLVDRFDLTTTTSGLFLFHNKSFSHLKALRKLQETVKTKRRP